VKNPKTFSKTPNLGGNLARNSIEKGRFLVSCNMLQVEIDYSTTYHLKASKGIPLLDKMAANLVISRQN
jgi:hypothetical protein